jgi:hypothetical protein
MNHFASTRVAAFDEMLDEITCGNCAGSSIWKWELGFFYVTHGQPPSLPPSAFGDGEFISGVISKVREIINARPANTEPASGWHGQGPMSTTDDCRASGTHTK